uniref:Kelch domain containing 7A n=1 Tax=Leptobrachium leishanense TaxID=445787 RepID=A0A8C5PGC9_9ANUR
MAPTFESSGAWQSDMQLMGKLALSVSALFVLALAYRFYKSRTREIVEASSEDARVVPTEEIPTFEASPRSYPDHESATLRFRRNNLQSSEVLDHQSKQPTDDPLNARELLLPAQEGLESLKRESTESKATATTCEGQDDVKHEGERESDEVPDQKQESGSEDSREEEDTCDGDIAGCQSPNYRQDPEGIEMKESLDLGNDVNCTARATQNTETRCNFNVSTEQDHQSIRELHRFSSTTKVQIQENIIPEKSTEDIGPDQNQSQGSLRRKIYDYHVESTSQSCRERNVKVGSDFSAAEPPLAHFKEDVKQGVDEESLIKPPGQAEEPEKDNEELLHELQSSSIDVQSPKTKSEDYKGPSNQSLSDVDSSTGEEIQFESGAATYHVSLGPESTFDVHLDLDNCYDVLSLAKQHNQDDLKAAAYKLMSINFLQVLQNPSVYGRLNATERDLILEKRMKGRRYVVAADIDSQGFADSKSHSTFKYYDHENGAWRPLSLIPKEAVSRGCSIATMFNYVFIALGSEGPERQMKPSKRVVCYNPYTNTWRDISPLKEARPQCKLVALDGYLYAIGGECLHTVERYDPRQNRWSYVAPLPNDTFAVAHMATAYDDEIYVTGGTIRYMLLRYRPKENLWKNSVITGSKDRTTDMVAANNFLYRFDLNRSMGITVHRCNIRARIWYECASYPVPYPVPFQCAVIDNSIFCVSRNFHLRFLTDDVSPRFMEGDLPILPQPRGVLFPLVLTLPVKTPY